MSSHRFSYQWYLRDGYPSRGIEHHKSTVFSTFACGGGSTMGYKLAGYDVIGANDIDPQMKRVYEANHHPKHYFLSDIRGLINKTDWPKEFYDLDILDGSPPCSVFSTAGDREKAWGVEKVFREGQARQTLDDLFFEFIDLAKLLQPKLVIGENVKGMLLGNAKGYLLEIRQRFEQAGYTMQLFLLNAASMGVPQKRERVFFVAHRKDVTLPKIDMGFNELPITFADVKKHVVIDRSKIKSLTPLHKKYWLQAAPGESVGKFKTKRKIRPNHVLSTIDANSDGQYHYKEPRQLTSEEYIACGSFPVDYNFLNLPPKYLIGMSVPPVMMAQVAYQVYLQWISEYN